MTEIPMKRCTKCGKEYPATQEWFRVTQGKLRSQCRPCNREYTHQYVQEHHEQVKERGRIHYRENKAERREYSRHHYRENIASYQARSKEYREQHKDEIKEGKRIYYQQHSDEIKEKRRHQRDENRDEVRKKARDRYAKHPDRARAYSSEYKKQYPDKVRAWRHRRRASKLTGGGTHTVEDIRLQALAQTDKRGHLRCWWCGEVISGTYHIDHRVPLSRGGSNNPDNICISCPTCNLRKGTKLPHEWNDRLF